MMKLRSPTSVASVKRIKDGQQEIVDDLLATEEPLQIRLQYRQGDIWQEESLAVTMRTPGNDFELTTGFLLAEHIIHGSRDIERISYCRTVKEQEHGNVVNVKLTSHVTFDVERLNRHFFTNASCGVCGKSAIDAVTCLSGSLAVQPSQKIAFHLINQLNQTLEKRQTVFRYTGGLHASALFNLQGECLLVREDIGRHNAFDKVVGAAMALDSLPLNNSLILLSGRVSYELVQKAVRAGITIIVAVGAPSSLAVELAVIKGITLVGFLRAGRCNVYTHPERIQ